MPLKSEQEIKTKISELEAVVEEAEKEFEEELEDREIDEFSKEGEKLQADFERKKGKLEAQVKILKWVLNEE